MGVLLLTLRVVLAAVFAVAGGAKLALADVEGSRRAVVRFGVPRWLAGPVTFLLALLEVAAAAALSPTGSARFGVLGAGVLLVCLCGGIVCATATGADAACHCFGQLHSAPIGWRMLARNLVLLGIAVREQRLWSTVLLDAEGEAMLAFAAGGTPMAGGNLRLLAVLSG